MMVRSQQPADPGAASAEPAAFDPAADTAASWLGKAARGDRGAFGRFVVLYQDRLFNSMLRLVGDYNEAAELTQEAFTRALANLHQYRAEAAPYTWLFRIATNLGLTRLRQVQRRRTFSLEREGVENARPSRPRDQAAGLRNGGRSAPSPLNELEQRERSQQVLTALGRLDPEQRVVLVMRDVDGFDYQQMADLLNVPLGTLKSRLFRARTALRDQLKHLPDRTS